MEIFFTDLEKIESIKEKCKYILLYTADLVTNNKNLELEIIINDNSMFT